VTSILLWSDHQWRLSATRHLVRDLDDLRDVLASQLGGGRVFYLESRPADEADQVLESHLRFSIDDVTSEDFRWLTAAVRDEVRGVRA
jgi:hypothetical protein